MSVHNGMGKQNIGAMREEAGRTEQASSKEALARSPELMPQRHVCRPCASHHLSQSGHARVFPHQSQTLMM